MAAAEEHGVTLPSAPTEKQQATLEYVSAQSGEAFDMAWVESQITAHRHTISIGEEFAQGSEQAAMDLLPPPLRSCKEHLDALLDTALDLGVPTSVSAGTGGQAATSPHSLGFALVGTGLAGIIVAGLFLVRRRRA